MAKNKYKVLMGTLIHGAQLVSQPCLVGLVSGPHQQTKLVGHNLFLHPTILKASLLHRGTRMCLRSIHETASCVKFQLQSKLELVTVVG